MTLFGVSDCGPAFIRIPLIAALLLAVTGTAPPARAAAGWTSYGTIEELSSDYLGRILVRINLEQNPTDCRNKSWFYRDPITGSEFMFRLLLEAVSQGKAIRVYVTGICDLNRYSEISKVGIAP